MTAVLALVPDGAGAVDVVRRAVRAAEDEHLPLVLVVALPPGPARRRADEAAAVLGRVAPVLATTHLEATSAVVTHRDRTGSRLPVAVADALLAEARRRRAAVLVVPAGLPVARRTPLPTLLVPAPTAPERTSR